jgi:folate-binding protein YgfZ
MLNQTLLSNRALLEVTGPDARTYLQGLLTNDVLHLGLGQALWAGLLSPQGKYLFDMLVIAPNATDLWLDTDHSQAAALLKRLTLYKLRAQVSIRLLKAPAISALWGENQGEDLAPPAALAEQGLLLADPRLKALGWRFYGPALPANCTEQHYDLHRLSLGIPDGARDISVDKMLWLEANGDLLNGVSFTKGCFVGQENTARMHHRAKVRKRLIPICLEGDLADDNRTIQAGAQEAGTLMSHVHNKGLALLRLDYLDAPLTLGDVRVRLERVEWLTQALAGTAKAD